MPYIFKKYYPVRNIFFFLGEGLLIFLAISGVYWFFLGSTEYFEDILLYTLQAMLVTLIFQICLYYFDLYDLSGTNLFADTAARITQAFGVGCIFLAIIYYLAPATIISTKIFFTGYLVICGSIAVWRFFYALVLDRRMFTQPILILGTGKIAENIAAEIENRRDSAYKIVAYAGDGEPRINPHRVPVVHDKSETLRIAAAKKAEKIIVALDDKRGNMPLQQLIACKLKGISIVKGIEFYESLTGKILVEKVNPSWIVFSDGFKQGRSIQIIKRVVDISLASFGLLISLPVILVTSVIIKLESPGTVFYTQDRIGEKGTIFKVIKFRSMRSDAEKDGPVWASENDSRVTRVGSFIRRVRIDEMPQMWGVLKGDMSFVGPRPERPVFVEQLAQNIPYYSLRHNIKPGITGWAQICYPYGASEEDALRKLEYDLYYIKNMSVWMDLVIVFQTIKTVLFQRGAR